MQSYIDYENSAAYAYADDTAAVLALLAGRFIGDNPPAPYVYRAFHEQGIPCDTKARYRLDFDARFPGSADESIVWAAGGLWCPAARPSAFVVTCFGPVRIYLNGELVFSSTGAQEGENSGTRFAVSLKEGCNVFLLRCEKTGTGFGCALANAMPQWEPCNFRSPFPERRGRMGFVFIPPQPIDPFTDALPDTLGEEGATGIRWLPAADEGLSDPGGLFHENGFVYIWTRIDAGEAPLTALRADTAVPVKLWLDGRLVLEGQGELEARADAGFGRHDILICVCMEKGRPWGAFRALSGAAELPLRLPADIKGARGDRLYLGVFREDTALPEAIMRFDRPFEGVSGPVYWRTQERDVAVRPFVETALYGRWTYPLGVTLYGLLKAGEKLGRQDYRDYVHGHVRQVAVIHDYALYDKARYGFPGVNHQIAWLDALDDCGSFGSLLLECEKTWPSGEGARLADRIARYIRDEQKRMDDGAFYRGATLWADDMYMSVPFLTRYALASGDPSYFDEACRQLLLYRKHLAMEDCGLMSHILSLTHQKANRIPWSRGNGWVIFSISQLLSALPAGHGQRGAIVDFYNFLVRGYLNVQGENGLWHQVLDDPSSYEESSATAMFICAFVRGITEGYMEAAMVPLAVRSCARAWRGLISRAVDRAGNVYGVCRGSGFSFARSYYRTLSWNFNDTHGIGILLLAGVEWMNLSEHLAGMNAIEREGRP